MPTRHGTEIAGDVLLRVRGEVTNSSRLPLSLLIIVVHVIFSDNFILESKICLSSRSNQWPIQFGNLSRFNTQFFYFKITCGSIILT